MDEQERRKVAVEIADALGETGGPGQAPRQRVERQIARMIEVMGEEWVRDTLAETEQYRGLETLGHNFRKDGVNRTDGGSFFATARASGYRLAERGEIAWPDFYRTFCWREREPRAPKPAPIPRRDKAHEQRAVQLFATKANCRAEQLSVVTAPRDSVWYDWADPDTNKIGQCRRDDGQWTQAPLGSRPVVLAYTARVTAKRKPATGSARAWGQGVRRNRPSVEPEVVVMRRVAR